MPAQLMCPNIKCRKILSVPDEARGRVVTCSHCQTSLRVPQLKGASGAIPPVKKSA